MGIRGQEIAVADFSVDKIAQKLLKVYKLLTNLALGERKKIYLIMAFISLILFFLAVWKVSPVIVEPSAPLGLASICR